MRLLTNLLVMFVSVSAAVAAIPAGGPCLWLNDYIGRAYTLRPSVNASPYVYLPIKADFATLEATGPMFPLLAPEPIVIRDVALNVDAGIATLAFRSEHGEKGRLHFMAPRDSEETMGQAQVDGLLALICEEGGVLPHVLNAETGMVHYKGSNHSRGFRTGAEFATPAAALADGYRLCPSCFAPIHLLPGYEEELVLGQLIASEVRGSNPASTDPLLQARAKAAGEKVLAGWSLPLRGYHYRFTVIESATPNAVACPGGWVFVTDALVNLCETDQELEVILAHEISHVEMRHGLRQLRSAQKAARIGAIAGALGAALLSSQGDSPGAQAAGAFGMLVVGVASELALAGYSREMEAESDAAAVNYIVASEGTAQRTHLARVLAKLEYFEQCETGRMEDYDGFWRHPPSAVRSDFAVNADTRFFSDPLVFNLPTSDGGNIALRISGMFHHTYVEPLQATRYKDMTGYEFGFGSGGSDHGGRNRDRSDTRIFAVVQADESVPRDAEFKDVEVMIDGVWWRFDNREDTSLYPGASTSVALVHRQSGRVPVAELTPTQVRYAGRVHKADTAGSGGLR